VALFGKSGAELIPMLNDGAAAMEKFTYKISDDFAARSDLFNDTLTTLEIQTKGFGLELTDALLPALQSILEEFAKLFDSKNDWTSLFKVITGGLRVVATFLYATIKLMDQWIKTIVYSFDAISKALKGDFAGAGKAISNGVGAGMKQAQQDFAAIGRMWTDATSPGTGLRTSGRNAEFTDLAGQKAADAAAKQAMRLQAQQAKREQEDYNNAVKDSISLADELTAKTRDIQLETQTLGAVGAAAIDGKYKAALNNIKDEQKNVFQQIQNLVDLTGGRLKFEGLQDKAKGLLNAMSAKASADRNAALKQQTDEETKFMQQLKLGSGQLGADEERRLRIKERIAQIEKDMPDLYERQGEEIRKLVEVSEGLTEAQQRNKDIVDGIAGTLGGGLTSAFDALISGTQSWGNSLREIASNVLKDIAKQLIQILIIDRAISAFKSIFNFGGGGGAGIAGGQSIQVAAKGLVASNGIQAFAKGGIVTSPTLFKFANGGAMRNGLMGEAGPEAIMPLQRAANGKLGVIASGGGSTSVVVNVDASGNANVQGDQSQAKQLGLAVSAAVQAELIKQKRPGGLLAA
jgi:lambda family phage tail tape measure protein